MAGGAEERNPAISPDGGWIAYDSDETGRSEVYLQQFPDLGDRRTVSIDGREQIWSPSGDELYYYRAPSNGEPDAMMAVAVSTQPTLTLGDLEVLFTLEGAHYFGIGGRDGVSSEGIRPYDISPEGERFLMIKAGAETEPDSGEPTVPQINIVLNWFEELKEPAPVP